MKKLTFTVFCVTMFSVGLVVFSAQAQQQGYTKPQELVDKSVSVIKSFGADTDLVTFKSLMSRAKGIFIVPQILKGGFIIGGSGGSGVLLLRDQKTGKWTYPAFYTIGAVSFGLQIGAESSMAIFLIMTDKGVRSMLSTSFKLGAEASVAVGPIGGGAKAATADILAYSKSKGAFTGATVEGAVINTRDEWNETYYKKSVSPGDIIMRHAVSNPGAETLRQTVKDIASN